MLAGSQFDGAVTPGQDYLLADDAVTQGGTLADLRSHIERNGGRVIGASTMIAGRFSEQLAPRAAMLAALREKFPGLEDEWKGAFGHDFSGLTNSEAYYLTRFGSSDAIRNRFLARIPQAEEPGNARGIGEDEGGGGFGEQQQALAVPTDQQTARQTAAAAAAPPTPPDALPPEATPVAMPDIAQARAAGLLDAADEAAIADAAQAEAATQARQQALKQAAICVAGGLG